MGKKWTKKDFEQLRKLFEQDGLTATEISKILNRSINAIILKISRLNLQKTQKQKQIKHENISEARKGNKNPMYGKHSWSFGLKKENSESLRNMSIKNSDLMKKRHLKGCFLGKNNGMYGKHSWNKGLTKDKDQRIFKSGKNNH